MVAEFNILLERCSKRLELPATSTNSIQFKLQNSPCLTPAHGAHGAHGAVCTGGAACLGVGTSSWKQQQLSALSSTGAECQAGGAAFTGKGAGAISPGSNSPQTSSWLIVWSCESPLILANAKVFWGPCLRFSWDVEPPHLQWCPPSFKWHRFSIFCLQRAKGEISILRRVIGRSFHHFCRIPSRSK